MRAFWMRPAVSLVLLLSLQAEALTPLTPLAPSIRRAAHRILIPGARVAMQESTGLEELPSLNFMPTVDGVLDLDISDSRRRVSARRRRLLRRRRANYVDSEGRTWRWGSSTTLRSRCIAECLGTFAILFFGTLVARLGFGGLTTALAWGLGVGSMVALYSTTSGAHFNPAVTLTVASSDSFPWRDVPAYLFSQYVGALLAALAAVSLVPLPMTAAAALPCASLAPEIGVTSLLVYACMAIGDGLASGRIARRVVPVLIGLVITSLNLAFMELSPGINPAMSAAPHIAAALRRGGAAALSRGIVAYTLGPLLGGIGGGFMWAMSSGRGHGAFKVFARLGRMMSPWYGEAWELLPPTETQGDTTRLEECRVGEGEGQQRSVVVLTRVLDTLKRERA